MVGNFGKLLANRSKKKVEDKSTDKSKNEEHTRESVVIIPKHELEEILYSIETFPTTVCDHIVEYIPFYRFVTESKTQEVIDGICKNGLAIKHNKANQDWRCYRFDFEKLSDGKSLYKLI